VSCFAAVGFGIGNYDYLPKLPCWLKKVALDLPGAQFDSCCDYLTLLSLEVLLLAGFDCFSPNAMSAVLSNTPLLCAINLERSMDVRDDTLMVISRKVPLLRRFNICRCCEVTIVGLTRILRKCHQLVEFGVREMRINLSDAGFLTALHAAKRLQCLDVGDCTLSPDTVQAIANLPNLEELGVCDVCVQSDKFGLDYIARHAPRLRVVRVCEGCEMFNGLARSLWKERFPHVTLVTNRSESEFWSEMAFPVAPQADTKADSGTSDADTEY
jgi:hypothetical protein